MRTRPVAPASRDSAARRVNSFQIGPRFMSLVQNRRSLSGHMPRSSM